MLASLFSGFATEKNSDEAVCFNFSGLQVLNVVYLMVGRLVWRVKQNLLGMAG